MVNVDTNTFTGDLTGDLTGDMTGNVNDSLGVAIVDATNRLVVADVFGTINGDVRGSVFADDSTILVDGIDGNIPASVLTGTASINVIGNTTGLHTGNVVGNVVGTLDGDLTGSVFSDDSGVIIDGINNVITTNSLDAATLRISGTDELGNRGGIRIITGGSGSENYDMFNIFSYHNDATNPSLSSVIRGRGTPAVPTAIQDNDPIHAQLFAGLDSNGDNLPAVIVKVSTEGSTSAGIIPGVYEILVTDSAGNMATAFKVDSAQNATVAGTSISNIMQCAVLTSPPGTLAEGMIAIADGNVAGWDPKGTNGGTSYPCYYDGSAWNALF
jgi:hypothetical protein